MSEHTDITVPSLQSILDEQGYVIVGALYRYSIGEVMPYVQWQRPDKSLVKIGAEVVVIGEATKQQWAAQSARYGLPHYPNPDYPYCYKVIAE